MVFPTLRWARISVAAILSTAIILTGASAAQASRTVIIGPTTTLDGLARKYGVSKQAIAAANGIDVEAILVDGRKLLIPDPPKPRVIPATMATSGKINGNRVSLRIGPSVEAVRVTLLDHGAPLTVTARHGEWLQVKTGSVPHAWVKADFVTLGSAAPAAARTASSTPVGAKSKRVAAARASSASSGIGALRCIKGDRVALRQGPSTDVKRLALMDDATPIKVLDKSGDWCKVKLLDGPTGWVLGSFVAAKSRVGLTPQQVIARNEASERRERAASSSSHRTRTASSSRTRRTASSGGRRSGRFVRHSRPEPSAPKAGSDVVRTAYAYRGTRYRYGGSARGGFDCSGFTRYVYGQKGVALPHNAAAQFSRGTRVSKSDLKAGDLVFFQTTRRSISHVGIYVGGGKFVHASSAGGRVRVDSLNSGYYSNRYRGARRVK